MAELISGRCNIAIVPMGVSPCFFREVRRHDAEGIGSASSQKRIVYAGRLIELKGVNYLVQALPGVLNNFPEAELIIVGSGPMKDDLVELSNRLNLGNKVVCIDKVPQEKLLEIYSSASLFVLPSIVNKKGETEGLGMVLLEAMACGLPVIGSNVGGIPDVIKDGETGLLARQKAPESLTEKITLVFSDTYLRQRLVENGYRFVKENFSWDVIAEKFIGIYRETLGRWQHADRSVTDRVQK